MAENSRPGSVLIRHTPLQGDDEGIDLRRLLPAWIISGVLHLFVLSLLLLFHFGSAAFSVASETSVIESSVNEDDNKDKNLENDEIGNDPVEQRDVDAKTRPHLLPWRARLERLRLMVRAHE